MGKKREAKKENVNRKESPRRTHLPDHHQALFPILWVANVQKHVRARVWQYQKDEKVKKPGLSMAMKTGVKKAGPAIAPKAHQ